MKDMKGISEKVEIGNIGEKVEIGNIGEKVEIEEERNDIMDILSDVDIIEQLEEGKKKGTKVFLDFEELAKELGI